MKYEMKERVRYSEVDEHGHLSLDGLLNLFQDVAVFHSADVGYGVRKLKSIGQAWLISSWQIELPEQMPALGDEVSAVTWAYDFDAFYGLRNHQLLDASGNRLAAANSYWILFDVKTQRPVRVSEAMTSDFQPEPRQDMTYAPRKMKLPGGDVQRTQEEPFVIGRDSLDTNHHVNNGRYIRFAESYLPVGAAVRTLRVEYKYQAHLGDHVCPCVYHEDHKLTVALNSEAGKPYAIVEFELW